MSDQAAAAAEAVPTYDEAFPSLPLPDEAQKIVAQAQKSIWAASALRPSQTTQVLSIPLDELQDTSDSSLGKKQSIYKQIATETNTTISRSVSKDRSVTITITGKLADVERARKALAVSLQQKHTIEVPIPKELHRFIIGKEGKTLKEIETNTSTQIRVPKESEAKSTISVTGTSENIRKAADFMQQLADERARQETIRLPILKAYHALILGPNSSVSKAIAERTNTKIYTPLEKDEIVITGEKPGTSTAAAEINAIYNELRKNCGELKVPLKKAQRPNIIGKKGATIAEIMEKTGVAVEVPKPESDEEVVILRGPQSQLPVALQLVYEKANSQVQEIINVPQWLHGYVVGRKSSALEPFKQQAPNVQIFLKGDDINLSGPADEVTIMKSVLAAFVEELSKVLTHIDKKVDPKFLPHLVGKAGATISQLQNESGAQINLEDPKDGVKFVRVIGSADAVKKASAAIDAIISKIENNSTRDIIVPQRFHAQLIGPQGATIKSITEQFPSIDIKMPRGGESEIVVVRGDKKDVEAAEKHIKKLIKQFEEEGFQLEVPVFKEFIKQIIGRQGAKIRQIATETSTRIRQPDEDADPIFIIIGRQKNCELARDQILKFQGELSNIVTEELNIDQRFHAALIGPKGRVISSIMRELGGVSINFPKDKTGPKANVVTIRGPKDDVAKAKARLEELATNEVLNHHTEEVKVRRDYIRFLIGRNHSEKAKLQAATGARLYFPRQAEGAAPTEDDDLVTIVGKKEAVQAAKEKILARVAQLENTTEDTVDIDSAFYKEFTANRGRFLRELSDDFGGVSITLPKAGEDGKFASSTIHLKGSKADVPRAIARMKEYVEEVKSRVTLEMQLPGSAVPAVMGPGGVHVTRIGNENNVNIKFPERKRSDRAESSAAAAGAEGEGESEEKLETVFVSGSRANCEKAIAELQALVPTTQTVEIDQKYFPAIIGEKGARISQLSNEANVRIKLPKNSNNVAIRGTRPNIEVAKQKLQAIVADLKLKEYSETFEVDPKLIPALKGNRGAAINEFCAKYKVDVDFPREKRKPAHKAKPAAAAAAEGEGEGEEGAEEVVDAEAEAEPEAAAAAATAATEAEGEAVEVEEEEEAPEEVVLPVKVTVTGYEKDVKEAIKQLKEKVKELESLVRVELSIDPRVHARLLGQRGANVRALQDKYKVRIVFPRDKNSWKIEIYGTESGTEEVKSKLEIDADDFLQDILDREHMQMYVKNTSRGQERPAPAQSAPFQVRNAPWQGGATDFPALGGAPKASSAPVWVRRS